MSGYFSLAVKNIFRKGTRTVLTMLGIAVGVASVILVNLVGALGTDAVNSELDSLGLSGISVSAKNNSGAYLTKTDLKTIREFDNVANAMPILTQSSTATVGSVEENTTVWGIDSGANQVISIELLHGRELHGGDVNGYRNVCLLDENLAVSIYGRSNAVGKSVRLSVGATVQSFTIVGITKTGSGILQSLMGDMIPSFAYIPYTTMQSMIGTTKISEIAVKIADTEQVSELSNTIISTLERDKGITDSIKTENLAKQRDRLGNLLTIVSTVLSVVGAISLLVAGLGIMTVMLVSVSERTREIGVKKAIGAKSGDILREFLIEALTISAFGSIIGIGIGLLVAFLAGSVLNMTVPVDWVSVMFVLVLSVALGGIFGAYPAMKAAKLQPVEALRHE